MKKLLLFAVALVIGGAAGYWYAGQQTAVVTDEPVNFVTQTYTAPSGDGQVMPTGDEAPYGDAGADEVRNNFDQQYEQERQAEMDAAQLEAERAEDAWFAANPEAAAGKDQPFAPDCADGDMECMVAGCANITDLDDPAECAALIELYFSTDGDNWADNTDWLETNTACTWKGVSCSNGHVNGLDLVFNQLSGPIPSSIGNLSALRLLFLDNNQLSGPIPSSIVNLSALEWLDLGYNQLSGPIPSSIGNLSALRLLDLSYNQLSGRIPSSIVNLSALEFLSFGDNQLSGPIPSSIGNLSALEWLDLGYNQLSGPIPSSIGNLSALRVLSFGANQLSGPIPSSISNLSALEKLYLFYNQICGFVPKSFVFSWPTTLPPGFRMHNNQLMTNGYDAAMTNWLTKVGFKFGSQNSKKCGPADRAPDEVKGL